jgi:hypothetical protein
MAKCVHAHTFLPHNLAHAMKETTKPWILRGLIVDELDFHRFHGRDGEDRLANAGAETAQQSRLRRQIATLVDGTTFQPFEHAKSVRTHTFGLKFTAYRTADFGMLP